MTDEQFNERMEALTRRHEALTMNVELFSRDVESRIDALLKAIAQDAENIRALARIAEIHERRLSSLEGE